MSAGGDVYDVVDYARASGYAETFGRSCLDVSGTPTASTHRAGLLLPAGGGGMSKSTIRSVAYFMIVGGIVVWVVGHLAPIRA